MADQTPDGSDAVQVGDNAFLMDGTQSDDIQIPEHLSVAEADFSSDGADLVMTFPDGTEVRVEGYHDNANPPKLVSADGAEVGNEVVSALTDGGAADAPAGEGAFGFIEPEQAEAMQAADSSGNIADNPGVIGGTDGEPIGNIENIEGEVWAIRADGERVQLELGDEVYQGDILESSADGNVGVLLADETTFAMGPEGRMVLDEMVYDPGTQEGSVSMSVLQGVFTFVSGQVAKTDPDAMTLDTPVATIGIRGTQVGLDLSDGQNLNVHLMEELFGFVGEVVVANDGGVQVLNDANAFTSVSSFDSSPADFQIVTVEDILASYGETTLPYLPIRNSDGERTSGNTFDQQPDVEGDDRDSLEFLNDFQTDAGGNEDENIANIKVVGEYEGITLIDQIDAENTDTNPFIDEGEGIQGPGDGDNTGDDTTTTNEVATETVVNPFEDEERELEGLGLFGANISPDGSRASGFVSESFDGRDQGFAFDITGSESNNDIKTSLGNFDDNVNAGGGDDTVRTYDGDDNIIGGAGNDSLYGGAGDDIIRGGEGNDYIEGGLGDDQLFGGAGDDEVYGGEGNDIVAGGAGSDIVDGGAGDDILLATPDQGNDQFIGGTGNDTIDFSLSGEAMEIDLAAGTATAIDGDADIGEITIDSVENVVGSFGDDIIIGDANDNILRGGGGDDYIDGGVTPDDETDQDTVVFSGARGGSTITVNGSTVTITGPDGTDTVDNVENFIFEDNEGLVVGLEDTAISLEVADVVPTDDGVGSIQVTGLPDGATLSAGVEMSDGSWFVSSSDLEGLTVTGALDSSEDFTLTFETFGTDYASEIATATEVSGVDVSDLTALLATIKDDAPIGSGTRDVEVLSVIDRFDITVDSQNLDAPGQLQIDGNEDEHIDLNIDIDRADGSETVSISISGLPTPEVDADGNIVLDDAGQPVGARLEYQIGTDADNNPIYETILPNDDGTYTVTEAQLEGLGIVGSPNDSDGFDIQITATITDGEATETIFGSRTINLEAVADKPLLSGQADYELLEDGSIPIEFSVESVDQSEHITNISLTGIPEGSSLSIAYTNPDDGTTVQVPIAINSDGVAEIPLGFLGEDLTADNLLFSPPANFSGEIDLTLQATSTEPSNGETATQTFPINVDVTAVADELAVEIAGVEVVDGGNVSLNVLEDGNLSLDISTLTDDTDGSEVLSVTIEGVPEGAVLSAGTNNGNGTWTLTAEEYGDFTITPPADSDVDFDLTVTVTNVDNNQDTTSMQATINVAVEAVADAPSLNINDLSVDSPGVDADGDEDTAIELGISAGLADQDGSETLSITISDVPAGAVLSAGTDNLDGTWSLDPADLEGLTITPPEHFSGEITLNVTAVSTENANGDTAETTESIVLNVEAVADAPELEVTASAGNEDAGIDLNIDPGLVDADGSEILSITISNVPDGAVLSAGTDNGDGSWSLSEADLVGLQVTPPTDSNEDFNLTITATSTESSNGDIAETSAEIPVSVLGVADDANLDVTESSGSEDTEIPLTIVTSLNDTDGSETLSVSISNIPDGAVLLSGGDIIAVTDGVANLDPSELAGLSILPPRGSAEDFTLQVTVTTTENDNDVSANGQGTSSVSGTLDVNVLEVADQPSLMLFDASGNEDNEVPLNIGATLTDSGETLSVTVGGLPEGVTLSAGTQNSDGTWTLEADDLVDLTMTLPENSSEDFQLEVSATSTTVDGTTATTDTGVINVSVAGVADDANLNLSDVVADEGLNVPLSIDVSLNDTDGSETLSVTISNVPDGAVLTAGTQNDDGSWTLDPADLDGLSVVVPEGSDTDFTLLVTATTTEDDNDVTGNGQGTSSVSGVINVDLQAIAETPTLVLQDASGNEDGNIPLDISAFVEDASETVSITIGNVPEGAMLSAGSNNNDGTWTLSQEQLDGLTITPPEDSNEDFQLEITATSTEEDGTSASTSGSLSVGVTGVADDPTLNVNDVVGSEDTGIALNISANLSDTDGSETLSVTISGVPEGAVLSAGSKNADGTWDLTGDQLDGLVLTPPAEFSGSISLGVAATSTENDGDSATVVGNMTINVSDVADAPGLVLHDAAGFEDDAIPLEITATEEGGDAITGVTITGVPLGATLSAGTDNGDGTWSLGADDLDGLTITPPENSNANFQLGINVTSSDGSDTATTSQTLGVSVTAVADKPTLNAPSQIESDGTEPVDLDIFSAVTDTDGSESLSINISNIPDGALLTIGDDILSVVDGSIDLTGDQLTGLQIVPPQGFEGNFTVQVTATATDTDPDNEIPTGLETNVNIGFIDVEVTAPVNIPDAPTLELADVTGFEDTGILLSIDAALTDPSETLSLTITDVPEGAVLSAGTDLGNGTWSLLPEEADGLTITPPADSNIDFNLTVTATSTTPDGEIATTTGTVGVDVVGVADDPNLTTGVGEGVLGDLGLNFPLDIASSLNDVDGSESLSINITDLPAGVVLSAGTENPDGSWTLTPEQLDGLSVNVPIGVDPDFDFNVTATATEDDGDTASVTQTVGVEGDDEASDPDLDTTAAEGLEDTAINLDISAALTDTDGSETLSITISDVPDGAVLSAGTDNGNGSWTLTSDDLDGLTITPPDDSNVDFNLNVSATSTEISSGATSTTSATVPVDVTGVADTPTLSATIGQPTEIAGNSNVTVTNMGQESAGYENSYGYYIKGEDGAPTEGMVIWADTKQEIGDDFTIEGVSPDDIGFFVIPNGGTLNSGLGSETPITFRQDESGEWIAVDSNGNDLRGQGDPALFSDPALNEQGIDYAIDNDTVGNQNWEDLVNLGDRDFNDVNINVEATGVSTEIFAEYPLDISAGLTDTDGSETLSVTIADLPEGATLSAGTENSDGSWTLTPDDLDGLTLTVPVGTDDFDLEITATTVENDGDTASVSTTIGVDVPVGDDTAEAPTLEVDAATGAEDNAIALDIDAALTDTDGSETLSITISGVPVGAVLSAGADNGDGTWSLTSGQLDGLTVTPPADSDVDFDLTVAATSTEENGGDTSTTTATIPVTVNAVADGPSVAAGDADGDVGQTVLLDIQSALSDTDGSETLSITVAGLPDGASLNAGTDNGDGSFTLTNADLDGLAVSLPEGSSNDFDLTVTATSTEDENNDQASNTVTAVINVDPLANDDSNVVENGASAAGNVLTGAGDNDDPAGAADVGSDEGNAIVDVTFGDTTKSFNNPDDVQSDENGVFIEIEGEFGSLKMYDNGDYSYDAEEITGGESIMAGLTGQSSGAAVEEAWSSVETFAFNFGTPFVDGDGKLDPSLADAQVSFESHGIGVEGSQNGMPAPDQINHDETTDESEALGVNLGGETTSATVTVSRLFETEDGGEQGNWQAFDADGNLVGEGTLNAQTVDYGSSNNLGTAEISLPDGAPFQYLVFTSTDTVNDSNSNDSSDFFVRAIQADVGTSEPGEDVFSYTMEDADGDTASATLSIDVTPEADTDASDPTLEVSDVSGLEDGAIALDIAASLTDIDGSETLSITIDGVPEGGTLSAGTENEDGTWTIGQDDLAGLTITPPENSNENISLTVTATSTEENGGATSTTTADIEVSVTGVADAPGAGAEDVTGVEDQTVELALASALTDTDGSETLSVTINGVPAGATLSAGTQNQDGSWSVDPADLASLSFTPPSDFAGDINMTMNVTSTENDGDTASTSVPFTVSVTADADAPTVSVGEAAGLEDTAIALDISAALTDTDGSESLSISIAGVPTGAILSAGTQNEDGTWSLEAGDLDGLTITPPQHSNEDFSLNVTATATEANGDTATTSSSIGVSVTGVADAPTLSATLGEPTINEGTVSEEITINSDNATSSDAGFTVMGRNIENDGTLSDATADNISFNTNPQGFGVAGGASGANSELGNNGNISEEMIVSFDNDVSSADVSFAWMNPGESATYELYSDGVSVGQGIINGGSDGIDPPVTFTAEGGVAFDQIVFSAPDSGDDYLINSISFETTGETTTLEYPLDISSSLVDADGSETLSINIDDLPEGARLSAGTENPDGSWTVSPGQLAGLALTVAAGTAAFSLSVSATTTENDGDTATVNTTLDVTVPDTDTNASDPNLAAANASGVEDAIGGIALDISSSLTDTDGSEELSITISGVPDGATLSAGTNIGGGSWSLEPGDLANLSVTPPADSNEDFTLNVSATSTEENGGETATVSEDFTVDVTGVADAPTLNVSVGSGTVIEVTAGEATTTNVFASDFGNHTGEDFVDNVDGWGTNSDAIEVWTNSSGHTGDGAYVELNDDAIDEYDDATSIDRDFDTVEGATYTLSFEYSPRAGYGSDVTEFQVKVDGEVLETLAPDGSNNTDSEWSSHTITFVGTGEPMNLEFLSTGVAQNYGRGIRLDNIELDQTITSDPVEAVAYDLDITSALTDTDGSETLTITIENLPDGATLSAGSSEILITDGVADVSGLTAAQLQNLTVTVPEGSDDFDLTVKSKSTENDGDTATVQSTIAIVVPETDNDAADPTLAANDITGNEDSAIALDIDVALADTDGSETLSVTIDGVPSGAVLSAGTDNGNGVWTIDPADVEGLTITPAANSNDDFNLTVTATSTEENGGDTSTATQTFSVDVVGVADGPTNVAAEATLVSGHGASAGDTTASESGSGAGKGSGSGSGSGAGKGSGSGSGSGSGAGKGSGSGEGSELIAFHEIDDGDATLNEPSDHFDVDLNSVSVSNDSDSPSGTALLFDGGNDDYIEIDHENDLELDSGTVVLWFNTDDADSKQGLFSKDSSGYDDGGHMTAFVDDGQLSIRMQNSNSSFTVQGGDVTSGAWHQMALSFGPDGMKLYMDGELVDSDNYTGGISDNEEPLIFGANQWGSGNGVANNLQNYFEGQMDGIAIYDRPLTPTELSNLYEDGAGDGDVLVYDLDIDGSLVDTDGSEELSFEVRGLPDGVTLSSGTNDGSGNWALTADDLDGLTLEVDPSVSDDFNIEVAVITTEDDGDTAESVTSLEIEVAVVEPVITTGTHGKDTLEGGAGDDTLSGGNDKDKLFGLEGDDHLDGGHGNDSLFGDIGDDVLIGGTGKDQLDGGAGNDTLDGGSDKDTIEGGEGDDIIFGGYQDDKLYGGDGNDTIDGGTDDDYIEGGAGDDVLTGGWGSDEFKMDEQSGHDIIQDIMDQDTIVFEGQEFHADDMIFNENDDGDVVVSFNGVEGQSVTLNGVSMDDLDRNNDGNIADGYSVTETDGQVTLTIDTQ